MTGSPDDDDPASVEPASTPDPDEAEQTGAVEEPEDEYDEDEYDDEDDEDEYEYDDEYDEDEYEDDEYEDDEYEDDEYDDQAPAGRLATQVVMGVGAALVVLAAVLYLVWTPQTPPSQGTVPQGSASAQPALDLNSGPNPANGPEPPPTARTGPCVGSAVGRSIGRRPEKAPVPAGKVAPVALLLPGCPAAPVIPQGVNNGRLSIPDTVTTLGWWTGGAGLDADAGSMVIVGHVDSGIQGLGYFAALRQLPVGSPVVVRAADGSTRDYRITGMRTYLKSDGLPTSIFDQDVQARLVLITCTGPFDKATRRYADNLVVYAVPVPKD